MRQTNWKDIAELVGIAAIVVSLLVLAFEVNQSGKQLELAASADSVDSFAQAMEVLVQDEELSRLIYRAEQAYHELDEFEKWRVGRYLDGYMSMSEQDYLVLIQIGGMDIAGFVDDMREYMDMRMYREYWGQSENRHGPEFQQFVNELLADLDSK